MQSLSLPSGSTAGSVHDADETMTRITAERLIEHLDRSG